MSAASYRSHLLQRNLPGRRIRFVGPHLGGGGQVPLNILKPGSNWIMKLPMDTQMNVVICKRFITVATQTRHWAPFYFLTRPLSMRIPYQYFVCILVSHTRATRPAYFNPFFMSCRSSFELGPTSRKWRRTAASQTDVIISVIKEKPVSDANPHSQNSYKLRKHHRCQHIIIVLILLSLLSFAAKPRTSNSRVISGKGRTGPGRGTSRPQNDTAKKKKKKKKMRSTGVFAPQPSQLAACRRGAAEEGRLFPYVTLLLKMNSFWYVQHGMERRSERPVTMKTAKALCHGHCCLWHENAPFWELRFSRRWGKIQVAVVWVVTLCSDVVGYRRFGGASCLHGGEVSTQKTKKATL
jgi:hypothetical protein